MFCASRVMNNE
ncbi:hypothetical protein A2U01_0112733, partial [Trifolium medium]|nr:hypothetical protein [Trifolium medium]